MLILIFILLCLLILALSVNLTVDTLAKAKRFTHFYSVAPLLEKWFACFPSSGEGLRLIFFPFLPTLAPSDGFAATFPVSVDGSQLVFVLFVTAII